MKNTLLSRMLVLCLMLALVLSLAACGSKDTSSSAPAQSAAPAVQEEAQEAAEEAAEEAKPEENAADVPAGEKQEEAEAEEKAEDAQASDPAEEKEQDAEAAADAGAIAEAALSSGAISVDGDLFVMGSAFGDLPGNWKLKPQDSEKYKDYSLNPRTTSGTAMGLYKDEYGSEFTSFHVMVSLMNASEAPIPYLEGAVDYLSIPGIKRMETVPPVILPGGLTLDSTEEEFIAVYGEPTYEYEDASTEFRSIKFEDGEVELQITWSKGQIDEITMMI